MKKTLLTLPLLLCAQGYAATFITDNFDTNSISGDWSRRTTVSLNSGGPAGSAYYATVTGTTAESAGLGDQIGGSSNFIIDFYFQVQNTVNRQFNIGVSTAALNPSQGDATINLRIQGNAFAVYQGSSSTWLAVTSLGSVNPGDWYRMQIEGIGWGTASATYSLRLYGADGTTSLGSAEDLTTIQNGSITGSFSYGGGTRDGTLQSFIFSTTYGSNPGFNVDNVIVTGDVVPEPSAALLSGAALLFPLLHRRRR